MQARPKTLPALALLRRFGLPVLVLSVMALVLIKGWHSHLTLENAVTQRDRFQHFLAGHATLSVVTYVVVYALLVALSLPCGLVLTVTGGLLFGWLGGALAAAGRADLFGP